jgi:hypothetical protein
MLDHADWQMVSAITKDRTAFSSGSNSPVSFCSTAVTTQISGSFNIISTKSKKFLFLNDKRIENI